MKKALGNFKSEMDARNLRLAAERNAYVESAGRTIKINSDHRGGGHDEAADLARVDLSRLLAYQNEIKLTREQRDIEMSQRKKLTEMILATWKSLKMLRARQQFRNTEYKLVIKK